jgi:PAS domain S-box-containing protein
MTMESGRREWLFLFVEGLPGFVCRRDAAVRFRFANRTFRERFGEPGGRHCCEILCGRREPCGECRTPGNFDAGAPRKWERILSDGRFYHMHAYPFEDAGVSLMLVLGLDITARRRTEEDLKAHVRRQAAVAFLGQRALADLDPPRLMDESAATVASVLGVEFGSVMELLPDGDTLVLRAGSGFPPGAKGRPVAVEAVLSQAGYPLTDDGAVIVEDYGTDTRVPGSSLLPDHGVISGAIVVISGKGRPFGILGAHSSRCRRFTRDDISFLQSVAYVLAAALDRRRAEGALKESEERFRSLVEHSPVGVLIVQEGRVVFRNPEQEKLFGAVTEGILFRDLLEACPEGAATFARLCAAVSGDGGAPQEIDIRYFPSGARAGRRAMRWAHCRTSPIRLRGKEAVLVNMVDITKTKELEHLVLVQEKMASLGQMAAGIAHEIRNPLSGLNLYLSALEKLWSEAEELEPENRETARIVLELMKTASLKIEAVIRRVMDFSRPTPPRFGQIDVNHAVREALHLSSVTLRRQSIAIEKSFDESLPHCFADHHLVEQVLLNLLTNAAQAVEGKEGEKRIAVASFRDGEHVVVTVADSGPGVPEEIRNRIFDPFFTTKKEGSGIGLSISHKIISDHGGSLTVGTSALGGAEFRIGLPIEKKRA